MSKFTPLPSAFRLQTSTSSVAHLLRGPTYLSPIIQGNSLQPPQQERHRPSRRWVLPASSWTRLNAMPGDTESKLAANSFPRDQTHPTPPPPTSNLPLLITTQSCLRHLRHCILTVVLIWQLCFLSKYMLFSDFNQPPKHVLSFC